MGNWTDRQKNKIKINIKKGRPEAKTASPRGKYSA